MEKIYHSLTELIGRTPLLEISHIEKKEQLKARVLVKLESFNPGGSVKDRAAFYMIEAAEKEGLLRPGSLIIEPTSGNTGIGLAWIASVKGYRLTLTMPAIVAMIVMAYGYYFQPMIDFRPYKVGTVLTNSGESFDDSNYVFIYEKNGVTKEFSINNLPDASWTFVDRRETVVNHEADRKASPITAYDGDNSAADNLIPEKGVTLLLLIPDIEEINSLTNFRLNDINDLAADSGYQMICLTGSDEKQLDEWRELSMADYPVYRMDDSQLKQIARGNPAVVIVADGKIAYKSSFTDFYADFDNATKGKHLDIKTYTESMGEDYEYFLSLMLALAIGMAALLTINRAPLFFKLARLKKNKSKKAPDNRQPSPNATDSDLN